MVEFENLSKDDQKIVCELMSKMFKTEQFTSTDVCNLSVEGSKYMVQVLENHLKNLGYIPQE